MVLIFPPVNEPLIFAVNMEKITINQNITIKYEDIIAMNHDVTIILHSDF